MRAQNFKQIGRLPKFFLPSEKKHIGEFNLEMWPGYHTSTALLHHGIYLNVDTCAKFINKESMLEFIN
jgi:hypothetical protein